MKFILHIALGGALIAGTCCTSCGGSGNDTAISEENRMVLTRQDTTATVRMVRDFMDCVASGNPDAAADMLYVVDYDDDDREPYPITAAQRDRLAPMLSMPVKRYEIVDCIYHTPESNEIQCRVFISDHVSTNWFFKPVRYLGDWYLCVKDSSQGDYTMQGKKTDIAR